MKKQQNSVPPHAVFAESCSENHGWARRLSLLDPVAETKDLVKKLYCTVLFYK